MIYLVILCFLHPQKSQATEQPKKILPKGKLRGGKSAPVPLQQVHPDVVPTRRAPNDKQHTSTSGSKMGVQQKLFLARRPKRPLPPGEERSRVPSVRKRIPAFRGTAGMLWEEALVHIVRKDAEKAKLEKASIKRDAIRQRWMMKMIQKLDQDYKEEELKAMVGYYDAKYTYSFYA